MDHRSQRLASNNAFSKGIVMVNETTISPVRNRLQDAAIRSNMERSPMTGGFFHEAFSSNGSPDRSCGCNGGLFQKATNCATISSSEGCSREQHHQDDAGQANNINCTANSDEGANCKIRAETRHHRRQLNLLLLLAYCKAARLLCRAAFSSRKAG
jgi:hypothetical protein